jgi:hypothetical protein
MRCPPDPELPLASLETFAKAGGFPLNCGLEGVEHLYNQARGAPSAGPRAYPPSVLRPPAAPWLPLTSASQVFGTRGKVRPLSRAQASDRFRAHQRHPEASPRRADVR